MTDVQFVHFREPRDGLNVVIRQTVTRIHLQAKACGKSCRFRNTRQFAGLFRVSFRISVTAGVNFNKRRANFSSGFDLFFIGIDKQ